MDNSQVRVLLVPFPITPFTAFAYFVYRRFCLIPQEVEIRYSTGENSDYHFAGGKIRRFDHKNIYKELETSIWQNGGNRKYSLKRMLDWCAFSQDRSFWRRLLKSSFSVSSPKILLESAGPFFKECLDDRRDLWQFGWHEEKDGRFFPKPFETPVEIPLGLEFGKYPVLKSKDPNEREVVKAASYKLAEGRVRILEGEHLGLDVIGPQSSGKSTFVFSLVSVMQDILLSLKSRPTWENLTLEIGRLNLDLGTPTLDAIEQGFAQDREKMQKLKRPWTMELALEALEKFSKAKAKPGLIVADLPGKVSRFSEIVASLADMAVIVVNNREEEVLRWRAFANNLGIRVVGEVRSRRWTEGSFSLITRYDQGEFVAGRVAGMERVDFSGDACVLQIAKFLLLDIIPAMVEERRRKIGRILYER